MNFKNDAELKRERESTINLSIRRRIRTSAVKIKSCLGGASAVKQRGAGSKVFRRRVAVLETKIRTLLLHCGRNTSYKVCLSCRESKAWRLAKEFSFANIRQGPRRGRPVERRQPKGFESKRQTAHPQIVSMY